MKKNIISITAGFVTQQIVSTLVAVAILNPFLNPAFNGTVRTKEQGLHAPSLFGGYLLLTVIMVLAYRKPNPQFSWVVNGSLYGLLIGSCIFVAGHLIVAGWSIIPPGAMLISGILDCLAPVATGIVIAYIKR